MAIRDRKALKEKSRELLGANGNAGRLVLIHAGVAALLSLALAVGDILLRQAIANTTGLGGLGTRSALQTAQQILNLIAGIFPLFWNMGFTYVILGYARGERREDGDLLRGFRRFGPVLRLSLLESLVSIIISIPVITVGSNLLTATPLGTPYLKVMMELMPADGSQLDVSALDDASITLLMEAMTPVLIGCAVLCMLVLLPVSYRLRLSKYFLMDLDTNSATFAMVSSFQATRRRCLQLLRLDVSFWWYYLGQLGVLALAYGDQILGFFGVTLPLSATVAFLLFYTVGLVCQVGLYYKAKNHVELTYALAYQALSEEPAEMPQPKPINENPPWGAFEGGK